MQKTSDEIWATTAQNLVVIVVVGAGWLLGRVDALVAIPALLACAGLDMRARFREKKSDATGVGPLLVLAGSMAAQSLGF